MLQPINSSTRSLGRVDLSAKLAGLTSPRDLLLRSELSPQLCVNFKLVCYISNGGTATETGRIPSRINQVPCAFCGFISELLYRNQRHSTVENHFCFLKSITLK